MEKDVKNCPFCGGEADLFKEFKVDKNDPDNQFAMNGYAIFCKCEVCGARGKEFISLESPDDEDWNNMACRDAIRAWNTRINENKSKQQGNPDISDIALKMAIAYVQAQYATELKSSEPFEIDEKDLFYGKIVDTYQYYNSLSIEENLLETAESDDE